MTQVLREVRLYGELGARFGRVHRLAVASAAEAARALCAVLPGFRVAFLGADGQASYHVYVGRRERRECIAADRKDDPVGDAPIRFVPAIAGSKRQGAGQTIVGAVLVIVGAVMSYYGYAPGVDLMKMGAMMMLGGVVQMLSPQRKQPDETQNNPSYGMDGGAFNNVDAGAPVPICYGRMVVGSVQVSAGLSTDQFGSNTDFVGPLPSLPLPSYMPRYEVDSGGGGLWSEMHER